MHELKAEALDRLKEIQGEMLELLDEADRILRHDFKGMIYERAKSYWLAHVKMALTKDHGYLGGSMCDFEDTLKEAEEDLDDGFDPEAHATPEEIAANEAGESDEDTL
jgi:hypothetical protein